MSNLFKYWIDPTIHDSPITGVFHDAPESAREIPCDSCEFADKCAVDSLECSAFRTWATSGDYKDSDIARLLR